jgi:hypothetical protein
MVEELGEGVGAMLRTQHHEAAPALISTPGVSLARPTMVPHIAAWTEEESDVGVILGPFGQGIAYPNEQADDRDRYGVLHQRIPSNPGRGRPEYQRVHARRQREVMNGLLCQGCNGPSSQTELGWLWLLHDDRASEPASWPENVGATHPPVCVPCALKATQQCPHLFESYIAVRVADPRPWGVYGNVYAPPRPGRAPAPEFRHGALVPYTDLMIGWVLAAQTVRLLRDCTLVALDDATATPGAAPGAAS